MKTQLMKICGGVVGTLMGLSSVEAAGPRITFDQAMSLKGADLSISVEKIRMELDTSTNIWREQVVSTQARRCDVELKIEGRDIAIKNAKLGEHYFGSMDVSCPKEGMLKTALNIHLSRVFFMGIRNCVESETMIDQDYCEIETMALRKETDIQPGQGLISRKRGKVEYYRIHSQAAKAAFEKLQLAPEGLNLSTIESFQGFSLSIGKTGREFFIQQGDEQLSSFSSGRNLYLSRPEEGAAQDERLKSGVESALGKLDGIIAEIQRAANPKAIFELRVADFINEFASAGKQLLAIISPVEFFRLEKRLKGTEQAFVRLAGAVNPALGSRDSFVAFYAARFDSYAAVSGYFKNPADPNPSPAPKPSPTRKPEPYEQFIGKKIKGTDRYPASNYWDYNHLACERAYSACHEFLSELPVEIRENLSCCSKGGRTKCGEEVWETSLEKYCVLTIVKVEH